MSGLAPSMKHNLELTVCSNIDAVNIHFISGTVKIHFFFETVTIHFIFETVKINFISETVKIHFIFRAIKILDNLLNIVITVVDDLSIASITDHSIT